MKFKVMAVCVFVVESQRRCRSRWLWGLSRCYREESTCCHWTLPGKDQTSSDRMTCHELIVLQQFTQLEMVDEKTLVFRRWLVTFWSFKAKTKGLLLFFFFCILHGVALKSVLFIRCASHAGWAQHPGTSWTCLVWGACTVSSWVRTTVSSYYHY